MKLRVDLSLLVQQASKMGSYESDFLIDNHSEEAFEIDVSLSSRQGLDIALDDLEFSHGVLGFQGRQVILFIPDHGSNLQGVIDDPSSGRKFHVAECSTLEAMRMNNRFGRYKATYNTSGIFEVYGTFGNWGQEGKAEIALQVCKNCLKAINYKTYRQQGYIQQNHIRDSFNIGEFLSKYTTVFKNMPPRSQLIDEGGYSDDWSLISREYRESMGFKCEICKVNLSSSRGLLHVHHINGNKRDNARSNLKALCIDCHRKQPLHDYMRVKHSEMQEITSLRKSQGLLDGDEWDSAIKLADEALNGVLHVLRDKRFPCPEVGYEVSDEYGAVIAQFEVAWPSRKYAIAIDDEDKNIGIKQGWKVDSFGDVIRRIN